VVLDDRFVGTEHRESPKEPGREKFRFFALGPLIIPLRGIDDLGKERL